MPSPANGPQQTCLVTGATGYVGGRLVPALLAEGYAVRVMVRDPAKVEGQPWRDLVDVAVADATDNEAVAQALRGVDVAYYLLHSIGTGTDFVQTERGIAEGFAAGAAQHGVGRIVYLGGMNPAGEDLSPHLQSRAEVGRVLVEGGVPAAVLQAGVVIGSGSASFEMLRYLTERLPAMITPRWVHSRVQPIAIRDVLRYLVGCAELPADVNRTFDIGGPDVLTYLEMMQRYAVVAGLPRRRVLPVPILSPSLSSHWVGLVTPVPSALARPLVESLKNTVVAAEHDIAAYVPDPPEGLVGFEDAVKLALAKIRHVDVPTRWSSASPSGAPAEPLPSDPAWTGGSLYLDDRECEVAARPEALWSILEGIGGSNGWYSFPLGWEVRGLIDRMTGGPGLRRGRRLQGTLVAGDVVDFWRVENVVPGESLRLRAEMRLPGMAWLELSVGSAESGTTTFHQRAMFHPRGFSGHLYWWAVWPFHGLVFSSMQRNVARAAERLPMRRTVSSVTPR